MKLENICALLSPALALFMLTGCATGEANKDINFNANSKNGIMVLGWEGLDNYYTAGIQIYFHGVDRNGKFDGRVFSISNGNPYERKNPSEYYVVEVEPGYYVFDYAVTHPVITKIDRLCLGTIKFEIQAGMVSYVGNIHSALNGPPIQTVPSHREEATAKLTEFPHITQPLTTARVWNVPYPDKTQCH
ncbi:hypothetical protein UCD39_19400 [Nitrospirillum sp. BR 11752]|uniref:hypothetical protein n=1 Tax=Nitrospirillum sp. BR 11752 TaxID=3104293 RepID=UPI002EA2705B|nr:hypothetical protein [Nitrospirillum sp. BR 11752]